MSWTTIDKNLCDGCGFCIVRCPRNYRKDGEEIIANAGLVTCNLCGQWIVNRLMSVGFSLLKGVQPHQFDIVTGLNYADGR